MGRSWCTDTCQKVSAVLPPTLHKRVLFSWCPQLEGKKKIKTRLTLNHLQIIRQSQEQLALIIILQLHLAFYAQSTQVTMYKTYRVLTIQNIPERSAVSIFKVKVKTGVAGSSEILATTYKTTRYHNLDGHNLSPTLMMEAQGSSKSTGNHLQDIMESYHQKSQF